MSEFYRFLTKILLYSVIFLLLVAWPVQIYLGQISFWSVLSGGMVGIFNIILAYVFNQRALNKQGTDLMKTLLMGMGIRLLVVAITAIIVVKLTQLKIIEFLAALLIYYIFLQWFEIRFIQKNLLLSGKQK